MSQETWKSLGTTKVHAVKQTSEKKDNTKDYNLTISITKLIPSFKDSHFIN